MIQCPICKKFHRLSQLLECDQKVTRKLSKYKSMSKSKLIQEFNLYSKIECTDCPRKLEFDQMVGCVSCGELICPSCSKNGSICKTCVLDAKLDKCVFCKQDNDMFRPCVKCYERICWSCLRRCRGCNQIICPHCDMWDRECQTCYDERRFFIKFK